MATTERPPQNLDKVQPVTVLLQTPTTVYYNTYGCSDNELPDDFCKERKYDSLETAIRTEHGQWLAAYNASSLGQLSSFSETSCLHCMWSRLIRGDWTTWEGGSASPDSWCGITPDQSVSVSQIPCSCVHPE